MKTQFQSSARVLPRGGPRQSGVALVATLIMLSLVTFMVVAFLGVARRERKSVEATITQGESRMALEAAFARAQTDLLARLLASGDKGSYGAMTMTNFQSPPPFNSSLFSPTNVNHTNALLIGVNAWLTNLANLQYDPLVPVFSSYYTNRTPFNPRLGETNLGRWMLDLNRNGMADYTDRFVTGDPHWVGMLEYPNTPHHATNRFLVRYTYYLTPAGRTLDLNLIHNQAKHNRLTPPALPPSTTEGYFRNLGLGPQEMNTAALLAELNPYWVYNYNTGAGTSTNPPAPGRDAFRDALAMLLFRNNNSYNNHPALAAQFGAVPAQNLTNAQFDALGNGPLMTASNLLVNPDATSVPWPGGPNSSATAQRFADINELFLSTRPYAGTITTNLKYLGTNNNLTFHDPANPTAASLAADRDRRAYYTLLNTLGVDSWPVDGKLNLNWSNAVFNGTNITIGSSGGDLFGFTDWHPDYFFFNAAELMIRASATPVASINQNWTGFGGAETNVLNTNYFFGGGLDFNYVNTYYTNSTLPFTVLYAPGIGPISNVYAGFWIEPNRTNAGGISLSVTNIPIYPFSYYTPELHRLLQFAANLYDATTTNRALPAYPTLFRPYFAFNTNSWPSNDFIKIVGYTTNLTDTNLLNLPVVDLADPNSRMAFYTSTSAVINASGEGTNFNALIGGTPVIVGARKGFPNFNEFAMQTLVSVSRRLEYVKSSPTNRGPLAVSGGMPLLQTNQSLILSLFNINAVEGWNSYAGSFPPAGRSFRLTAQNISKVVITNEYGPVYTNTFTNGAIININANSWPGTLAGSASFRSFLFTNVPMLSTGALSGGINLYFPTTNVFFTGQPPGLPGFAYATNYPPLAGFTNGGFLSAGSSTFNRSNGFPDLRLGITVTNLVTYALYEPASNRVVDFVTLTNLLGGMDVATALWSTNGNPAVDNADRLRRYFVTTRLGASNVFSPTIGITNQFYQSTNHNLTYVQTNISEWAGWNGSLVPSATQIRREIERFRRFMGLPPDPSFPPNQTEPPPTRIQAPYTATRIVAISSSWEVNDPLVHYTTRDLEDPYRRTAASRIWKKPLLPLITSPPPPGSIYGPAYRNDANNYPNRPPAGINRAYAPWGRPQFAGDIPAILPTYYNVAPPPYDLRLKDPGAWSSDSWDFPQRKFANLGWIGRVHRGTPWQTFYLKADAPNPTNWFYWARTTETMPTNDWRLVDVFSTAINADATRGLLSVNQTNHAAWAAVLSGSVVLSNHPAGPLAGIITPQTLQLSNIVGDLTSGLINAKLRVPMWNPVADYSGPSIVGTNYIPGDVVGYLNGPYGFINYYMAVRGTNQGQNPFQQVSSGNFANWIVAPFWSGASISYTNNLSVVVFGGVSYLCVFSHTSGAVLAPPGNPALWTPHPSRSFPRVGTVLSTPELSVRSPYLNTGAPYQFGVVYPAGTRVYFNGWTYVTPNGAQATVWPDPSGRYAQYWQPVADALSDVLLERIAQQNLGLMHLETSPRVRINAWGQALRPAERGIFVGSGQFQGMVTNYQITGEAAAVAVVRIDGLPVPGFLPRPLPPGAPQQVQPRVIVESFKLPPPDQ